MHHQCHTAYHRSVRPLVAKGSKLPDQWRARIATTNLRRLETQTNEQYQHWLKRTRDGISSIDRTPMLCASCGDGPFQGSHGINMHRRKSGCLIGEVSQKLKKQLANEKLPAQYCDCGDGPFYSDRALWTHRGWHRCEPGKARYTQPKEPIHCPDCGKGPFRSVRSIAVHKGMSGCVLSQPTA